MQIGWTGWKAWNCPQCHHEQRQKAVKLHHSIMRNIRIAAAVTAAGALLCGPPGLAPGGMAAAYAAAACLVQDSGAGKALVSLNSSREWQMVTGICAAVATAFRLGQ